MKLLNNIFSNLVLFLKDIPGAFHKINQEKGIINAFLVSLIAVVIGCVLNLMLALIINFKNLAFFVKNLNLFIVFLPVVLTVILLFILSLILQLVLKLFKGKGYLSTTYKILAYSAVPYLLFLGLPFFSNWVFFLTAFLIIYGIKTLHKFTALKSFFIIVLLYFAYWIISLFIGRWLMVLFQQVGAW